MPLTRSSCFYVSSLFFLVAVTGICIFASAYDVIFQIFHHPETEEPNYKNLAVFGGSYVLLGLLATIFGFSRYVTVKMARQDIPKTYMPITRRDLPKAVYEFVQSELDRVARLAKKATPLLEESGQPGWGKPESSLQDTHFETFMASTPHFIERAAVANSPDLTRPPNMSISAYVHMLIDQKLITRDIGLEYIAGYEQARFGGSRYDNSPVTMSPFQPQQPQFQPSQRHHNHQHYHRHHTSSGRQHVRQSSGLNPRHSQQSQHPNHDSSTASTIGGASQHLQTIGSSVGGGSGNDGTGGRENLAEEEYIRFMKVLSWILQELGWDQAAEEAYEEEFRAQERQREAEQQQIQQAQYQHQQDQEDVYGQPEERELEHTTDYYPSDEGGSTMMLQPRRKQQSQLSGDSYFIVGSSQGLETDPQFQPHHLKHPSQQGQGQRQGMQSYMYPNESGGVSQSQNRRMRGASVGVLGGSSNSTGVGIAGSGGGGGSGTFPSAGPRKLSRSGNMSTRSLLTMRTMRTATSSLKSWEQRP
ncbi:hypothetical protein BGZ96_006873 [Linnemannia gamsii]|uniref:Defect at low temperature protein 1 n=1 Tax=Linnemannia gamsii TaxID=64522 RepID=A0ABQ7K2S2_9FUNG|nr:hypothetical protein BGZ96_006873 [Linnemannia gamsii]